MPSHRALLVVAAAGLLSAGCNFILNPANSDEVTRCKNATECEQNDKFAGILANERTDAACKAPATGSGSFTSAKNNLVCSIVDKASVSCDAEAFAEDTPLRTKYDEAKAQASVYLCPTNLKGTTGCPSLNGNCDDPKAKANDFDICDDGSGVFPFAEPTADLLAQDVLDQHCRSYFCDDNFVCNANKKCVRCRDIEKDETDQIGDGACVDFALQGKLSSIYRDNGCDDDSVSDADDTKFGTVVVAP